MKAIQVRLMDDTGEVYKWTIRRVSGAINCTLGKKTRIVSGWEFMDHDNYARFAEGNWLDLVARVKLTANNYGFKLTSELS